MTIPRVELMAVLIGVRCVNFVKEQLKISVGGFSMCANMAEVEIGFISVHTKQSQGNQQSS